MKTRSQVKKEETSSNKENQEKKSKESKKRKALTDVTKNQNKQDKGKKKEPTLKKAKISKDEDENQKPKPKKQAKATKKSPQKKEGKDEVPSSSNKTQENSNKIKPPTKTSKDATEHLSRELQKLLKSDLVKDGMRIEVEDDNIFQWNLYFVNFEKGSQIAEDLKDYKRITGREGVKLQVTFPPDFPAKPPFMRVVYPVFFQYTGHITIGGSVCIEDLTTKGWNSKNEILPFFIMIRDLLIQGGALIDLNCEEEYSEWGAREAFERVARQHGWEP